MRTPKESRSKFLGRTGELYTYGNVSKCLRSFLLPSKGIGNYLALTIWTILEECWTFSISAFWAYLILLIFLCWTEKKSTEIQYCHVLKKKKINTPSVVPFPFQNEDTALFSYNFHFMKLFLILFPPFCSSSSVSVTRLCTYLTKRRITSSNLIQLTMDSRHFSFSHTQNWNER